MLISPAWVGKVADFGTVLRRATRRPSVSPVGAPAAPAEASGTARHVAGGRGCFAGLRRALGFRSRAAADASAALADPQVPAPVANDAEAASTADAAAEETPDAFAGKLIGSAPYISPEAASVGTESAVRTEAPADVPP